MPTRKASASWEGGIRGRGTFAAETGIGGKYTAGSRFEQDPGSNPEELLAAAEAACFSMALSGNLERAGATPKKIDTRAECTVEKVDEKQTITSIRLETEVSAEGISPEEFARVAEHTKETCPVSRAFKGNVRLELTARLV